MKRLLLSFLLAALGAVSLVATDHPLKKSVFPLASFIEAEDGTSQWFNICTTELINSKQHLFITAAHCVVEADGGNSKNLFVGEEHYPAVVQRADVNRDIALIYAEQPGVALKLRTRPLQFGEGLQIPSFQLGWWVFMLTRGQVTNPDERIRGDYKAYMWHNVYGCGGSSGSPVLDKDGKMVGVEQVGARQFEPCSGVGGSATLDELKDFSQYFEK